MNELTSRYASALFSLKKDSNKLLEAQKDIKELIKILNENPEYPLVLSSSYLEKENRLEMVEEAFSGVDEEIKTFIKIIVENNRASYLKEIFQDFNSLVNEYRQIKEGLLYSSIPLKEEEISKIASSIAQVEKCEIELKNVIDPTLLGGVKVVINDHIYDGSIKHKVEQMKLTLLK